MRRLACLALVLLVFLPAAAGAVVVVVGGHGGYGSYTQEDLNAGIRALNNRVGATVLDEIKAGAEYGGHLGLQISRTVVVGGGFVRLAGGATGSAEGVGAEVAVPADCWLAFLNWLPDNDNVGRIGLGADAGVVTVAGFTAVDEIDGSVTRDAYEGAGLFLAGYVIADLQLGGRTSLFAHGGFRLAQVAELDLNGTASDYALDYSGAFIRVGLRLAIGGDPR
jgi:hypothetical protein